MKTRTVPEAEWVLRQTRCGKLNENSSVISQTGKDASGRRITGQNKAMVNRISVWDRRAKTSGARTRNRANSEITRISEILHIPEQVKQRGAEIYRECEKRKMLAGRKATVFSVHVFTCRAEKTA